MGMLAPQRWLLCLAILLPGCALQMDLPPGFLRLTRQESSDLRALSADDARIWVREFRVQEGAGAAYWAEVFTDELRRVRGYELGEPQEIRDGSGRTGVAFVGRTVVQGERCGYFAALFLRDGWFGRQYVRLLEYAAREAVFDAHLDAVQAAVATLR